jgi:hypothetical protein
MKTLKLFLKPITYLLAFLILFQGCTVYKKTGVTLEEASKSELKAIVEKTDGTNLKFKKIVMRSDGNFYGLENRIVNERWTETSTLLNENIVAKVIIENRRLSIILTIVGPIVLGGFIGLVIISASFSGF